MRKFNAFLVKVIPSLIIGLSGTLLGYMHPEKGCYALQADLLFLYPCLGDTYYVLNNKTNVNIPNGDRIANTPGFSPAFRLEGFYGLCFEGQDLRLNWTYFHDNNYEAVYGGRLFEVAGYPQSAGFATSFSGQANSEIDIIYQNVELLFEQRIYQTCLSELYFKIGLDYTYFRIIEIYNYRAVSSTALDNNHYKGKTWGIGPEIGLEGNWYLCSCRGLVPGNFSLVAGSSAAFLVANSQALFNNIVTTNKFYFNDKSIWRAMPTWYGFFGFNYLTSFRCYPLALEIGYEFTYLNRAYSQVRTLDDSDLGASFNNYQSVTMHGPYASASLSF